LKIDQSFVRGCGEQHDLQVIVRSSIELSHKLGMTCTAEGVETRQDWDSLRAMDCDVAQGYFIARPMDVAAFLRFCAEHDPAAFARGGAADVVPQ
ncbi:MAG: EAL domain-containing protein, partial [Bdellovibrionales bacterium]|nr:EAL domain-containing protein [Bdellovibrionales bacterium]